METSSEFRSVHAAREALSKYRAAGRDLKVIEAIPLHSISNYGVWQAVFERERAALRELYIKEYYQMFLNDKDCEHEEVLRCIASLAITVMTRHVEFDSPISVNELIKIVLDCKGEKFLQVLQKEAAHSYERRLEIVKPYFKPDNEWVSYSKKVLDNLTFWEKT